MNTTDFLIIGGGIIGLGLARELRSRYADASITVIDKEALAGAHASGRNSGVLHAGFYYTADSLKARFTRDGNRLLTEYCEQRNLPINKCGKLVVAKDEAEDAMLDELMRRGSANGVPLEMVTLEEARVLEPRVKTLHRAIFSPTTSSANPGELIKRVETDARAEGIKINYGEEYRKGTNDQITTSNGQISAGFVINAAGLYADKIARQFGYSQNYAVLPFKGLYLKSEEPIGSYRTHIYPVPDLKNPFLGVHFTIQVDGHVKIGPTAIPALWREQYEGLSRFSLSEFSDIAIRSLGLLTGSDFDFKRLAATEIMKYSRRRMVDLASTMVTDINHSAFKHWAKPGIRAQLLDLKKRKLEMDFVLEGDDRSMHVLNAVSPGWTCSIPFSAHIVDQISRSIN